MKYVSATFPVITYATFRLKEMWRLAKAMAEIKREH